MGRSEIGLPIGINFPEKIILKRNRVLRGAGDFVSLEIT
jgi:hypothetical protein